MERQTLELHPEAIAEARGTLANGTLNEAMMRVMLLWPSWTW